MKKLARRAVGPALRITRARVRLASLRSWKGLVRKADARDALSPPQLSACAHTRCDELLQLCLDEEKRKLSGKHDIVRGQITQQEHRCNKHFPVEYVRRQAS